MGLRPSAARRAITLAASRHSTSEQHRHQSRRLWAGGLCQLVRHTPLAAGRVIPATHISCTYSKGGGEDLLRVGG